MKMLVDDRWFGATGIGRYAAEILRYAPSQIEIEKLSKTWAIKNPLTPLLLGYEINRKVPDLFWSPGFMPPLNSKVPFVVTVHDLIHLKFGSRLQRVYYNTLIRALLKKSACVLTVSEYSRGEIINWSGLPADKVVAVYNGVSEGFSCEGEKYKPGYNYILYVGNKRKHKNLRRLLTAFSRADLSDDIKLVLTGGETKELHLLAQKLGIAERLRYIGYVSESELPSIYRGAMAVVLVSLCEGFGIPVVEGMACCTPVLVSNEGALPEVAGDAALKVSADSVEEISSGLATIAYDNALREKLVLRGSVRSREFDWKDSASHVWHLFGNVLER